MTFAIGSMLGIWGLSLSLILYGTYCGLKHARTSPPHLDAPFGLYPVSILKPLKGADAGLAENLATFFALDYPGYELVFSVASRRDPAVPVVESLMRANPRVDARLIVGDVPVGINPKVNNLVRSYRQAKYDWILISDSNVRVDRDYLKRQVGHVDASTGILTCVVSGHGQQGVGGELEAIYLNTFYARGMHLAASAGKPCVIGKSMLFRRSEADRFGGMKVLARYLAEDFMAGEAMRKLGLQVVMASDPIHQHIGEHRFRDFWSRHLRWGRLRKAQAPVAFFSEPWFGCIASMLIGAYAFSSWLSVPSEVFVMLHLGAWSACDSLLMRSLKVRRGPFTPIAWFLAQLLVLPLWVHIALGRTVNWRGKRLAVQDGGLLVRTELE